MTYRVTKLDTKTDNIINYGQYDNIKDVNLITRGYRFNGLTAGRDKFLERKGSRWFFVVSNLEG